MKNYLWGLDSWGADYPPQNVDEINDAANEAIREYAKTLDEEHDIYYNEKITLFCENLWERFCQTSEVNGVKAIWKVVNVIPG